MRRTLALLALTGALLVPMPAAIAANGEPNRPDGPVVPVLASENGGDNGWGNCGHNSSGRNPHTGSQGQGGGNGGYQKGEDCGAITELDPGDPGDPTDPDVTEPDPGDPTDPTDPTDASDPSDPIDWNPGEDDGPVNQ